MLRRLNDGRLQLLLRLRIILHPLLHHPPVLLFLLLEQAGERLLQGGEPLRVVDPHRRQGRAGVDQPRQHPVKILLPFALHRHRFRHVSRRERSGVLQGNAGPQGGAGQPGGEIVRRVRRVYA